MTIHDCPHCECDECAFCGAHIEDATHSVSWDYYDPPSMYSKRKGHQRDERELMCNTCAQRIDRLLSGLQIDQIGVVEGAINDVASHPMLRDDD